MSRIHVAVSLCLFFLLPLGCAGGGMPPDTMQPATAWSQSVVTQLAGELATHAADLYTAAYKDPEFVGQQAPAQETLNHLRVLQEETAGFRDELAAGKTMEQTRDHFERIQEVARDTRETDGWEDLADDFKAQANTAFGLIKQLDAYYGTP